ncbi:MAG: flagellar basal body L-ring protein FlgH [Campylobacterota bacterium]|nr:flagellar basal body L-ring protein FlgH [Campylobacterota bacterium]
MRKELVISTIAIALLGGCTGKYIEPEMDFKPPEYVEEMPAKENENLSTSQGSIFGQGDNPLFSDHKAMHVNDIVTVSITESINSSNSVNKNTSESDTTELGGGTFSSGNDSGIVSSVVSGANNLTNVGFTAGSTSSYTGAGAYSKAATFTTTVSARIIKVLENGNYFISGRREMMIDDEKQILQLSGVIRPYDIDQNNQIGSGKISDAKILYNSQGELDRSIEQGWGTKAIKAVWPF